jgi:hypothetical protein
MPFILVIPAAGSLIIVMLIVICGVPVIIIVMIVTTFAVSLAIPIALSKENVGIRADKEYSQSTGNHPVRKLLAHVQ